MTRSRVDSLPSSEAETTYPSEAETTYPLEGRFATLERGGDAGRTQGVSTGTLERGGDRPAGSRGMRMGRTLGFFESFPFSLDRKEAVGLCGPSCFNRCLRFKAILVPRLGCP